MSFQVDGIITYTQQGKINCTIVDIGNKQKYTIVESSIRETAVASEEDIAKLSGSQSGDVISNEADSIGVDKTERAVISSDGNTIDTSVTDEKSGTQDTVAEQINTEIKNKKIPDVTKLEFVLQKSPETGTDAAAQKIAGPTDTVEVPTGTATEGPTGTAAVEEKAAVEETGPDETSTNIDTSSIKPP